MSINHSSSGDGEANLKPKQLTPQELREQRLARFEKKAPPKPPPSSTQASSDVLEITAASSTNQTAASMETNSKPKLPDNIDLNAGQSDALRVAALAEKEDQDLQAALALSMGLPVPPKYSDSAGDAPIEPLSANGALSSSNIPMDLLATAAVVAATAPALGNLHTATESISPMRIETSNPHDTVMEHSDEDDRKPAAKPTSPKSPGRILKTNPQHFSGRVRTWYETASPYNILDFHDCMWTKGVTTENDQKRWLSQGIQFKDEIHPKDSATNPNANTSLLETIISGPGGKSLDLLIAVILRFDRLSLGVSSFWPLSCGLDGFD